MTRIPSLRGRVTVCATVSGVFLLLGLAGSAHADWIDHFDGASLDPRWTLDAPHASTGINFNGTESRVEFTTNTGANMWATRSNAPILWVAAPNPAETTYFEFEAKTTMVTNVAKQIAGVMAWNGNNNTTGVRAAQFHEWPDNIEERASFQVYNMGGASTPGITGDLNVTTMWLKLRWDDNAGAGGVDRWTTYYATSDPAGAGWTEIATNDGDYPFSRLGLFLKSADAPLREAHFDYAALTTTGVTISTVGDGTGYDDTTPAYLSTDVPKTSDVDGDNAYGTAGRLMFGESGGGQNNGQPFETHIDMLPSWVTSAAAGTDFASVAYGYDPYAAVDDPEQLPGPSVPVWDSRSGIALSAAGGIGFESILDFTIGEDAPQQFRVGVMAGNEGSDNGRWDPIGIRLTGPGDSASVTELPITEPGLGWVFFDVDMADVTGGRFTISAQQRLGTQGPSIGGITFDVVPEPSTLLLAMLGLVSLGLVGRRRGA